MGVPIWIDNQPQIAHAKTTVIDGAVTLMGSYNWTPPTRGLAAELYGCPDKARATPLASFNASGAIAESLMLMGHHHPDRRRMGHHPDRRLMRR